MFIGACYKSGSQKFANRRHIRLEARNASNAFLRLIFISIFSLKIYIILNFILFCVIIPIKFIQLTIVVLATCVFLNFNTIAIMSVCRWQFVGNVLFEKPYWGHIFFLEKKSKINCWIYLSSHGKNDLHEYGSCTVQSNWHCLDKQFYCNFLKNISYIQYWRIKIFTSKIKWTRSGSVYKAVYAVCEHMWQRGILGTTTIKLSKTILLSLSK